MVSTSGRSWPGTSVLLLLAGALNAQRDLTSSGSSGLVDGDCQPAWVPTFGGAPGVQGTVRALAEFDDGRGRALYVGGLFWQAGGVSAASLARWDGSSWSAVGGGVDGTALPGEVLALQVFDDGSGPALFVGGSFREAGGLPAINVARWDGASWSPLGGGTDYNGEVEALAVFDDGRGPALYAGGDFVQAGGLTAFHVARWDGASWSPVGGGTNARVEALTVFDDGSGPALYAGGGFTYAGGQPARSIAKWDGTSWSPLGAGTSWVHALHVFDDGSGPALLAGLFGVRKWNGTSWVALEILGQGVDGTVHALATVADEGGAGPALLAGGSFSLAGGVSANGVARWDGTAWSPLGAGTGTTYALAGFHEPGSDAEALFAGGSFTSAGDADARALARWDGERWSPVGIGMSKPVLALTVFDDPARGAPALYAGGEFSSAGGVPANRIASWDGARWSPLGAGMNGDVLALASFDDGGGAALYAAGRFTTAGGVPANRIARWDGSAWSALREGRPQTVRSLAVFNDGSGRALYAGGDGARPIARWNGTRWDTQFASYWNIDGYRIHAMAVFDDGSGRALYVGGLLREAGSPTLNSVFRYRSNWSALGSGMTGPLYEEPTVLSLAVFDDGGGPALYAGGHFTGAGGVPADHVARWDGAGWSPLASGVTGGLDVAVHSLAVFDDGHGPALYAGGQFAFAGTQPAVQIARWDGASWSPLGAGLPGYIRPVAALVGADLPNLGGAALYAGGSFPLATDSGDGYLARWAGCFDRTPPVLACPTAFSVPDAGEPGETVTFLVTAHDERDPHPALVCVPPSGSLFPAGTTLVVCKATDASGNLSECSFPVSVLRKQGR